MRHGYFSEALFSWIKLSVFACCFSQMQSDTNKCKIQVFATFPLIRISIVLEQICLFKTSMITALTRPCLRRAHRGRKSEEFLCQPLPSPVSHGVESSSALTHPCAQGADLAPLGGHWRSQSPWRLGRGNLSAEAGSSPHIKGVTLARLTPGFSGGIGGLRKLLESGASGGNQGAGGPSKPSRARGYLHWAHLPFPDPYMSSLWFYHLRHLLSVEVKLIGRVVTTLPNSEQKWKPLELGVT